MRNMIVTLSKTQANRYVYSHLAGRFVKTHEAVYDSTLTPDMVEAYRIDPPDRLRCGSAHYPTVPSGAA